MFDDLKHCSFVVCMLDLLHFDDLLFFKDLIISQLINTLAYFDGIKSRIVTRLDEVNTTKATGAECSLN